MERILVVEDDRFFQQMYTDLLTQQGYEVDTASSGEEALQLLEKIDYQLIITDLVMPGMDGLELMSRVKQQAPAVDVILVTGHANLESAIYALKSGARDYLLKPINHDEFLHSVALCFDQRRLINENLELRELLDLFQVGQNIANCLDMERLSAMVVDTLAKQVGGVRSIALFPEKDNLLALKEVRGISQESAEKLAEIVLLHHFDSVESSEGLRRIRGFIPEGAEYSLLRSDDISEAALLFIRSKTTLHGIVAVFNDAGTGFPADIKQKSIHFLLEQSSLAFDNASRYTNAKSLLYIDELSGLFNYRYLDISLERELKRAERFGTNVSMIFIDLDYFKLVNDTHGHLIGSQVLSEVGQLLKRLVREVDIVIRYGGDEFTVILVETGERGAATVAERIRRSIEEYRFQGEEGLDIKLTASLGYACYPVDTLSKQELLELADRAMYRGKEEGKNCVFRAISLAK